MQVNFYVHCNRTRHKLISSFVKLETILATITPPTTKAAKRKKDIQISTLEYSQ